MIKQKVPAKISDTLFESIHFRKQCRATRPNKKLSNVSRFFKLATASVCMGWAAKSRTMHTRKKTWVV
ncbi:MAG: hypothetical protein WBI19_05965, partial [Prolixibacteraceae bacterium]